MCMYVLERSGLSHEESCLSQKNIGNGIAEDPQCDLSHKESCCSRTKTHLK